MMPSNVYETWDAICAQIKTYEGIAGPQFEAYFSRIHPQAASEGYLALTADNDFILQRVQRQYLTAIERACKDLYGVDFLVEIEVDESAATVQPSVATQSVAAPVATQPQPMSQQPYHQQQPVQSPLQQPMQQQFQPTPPLQDVADSYVAETPHSPQTSGLVSSLTFENFVIGDSNRVAYQMAVSVAEQPGAKADLNPLFIYGKSGLGKTHLLRAIQNYIMQAYPAMNVVYVDSSEFVTDYTAAVASHDRDKRSFQTFQNRYLDADVLLIDDVQFFQGKSATLDTVFSLFNRLTAVGKQVVLSADRSPKLIDIDERYQSRFNSGGTFEIEPPSIETKLGIIKNFIDEYIQQENGIDLRIPEDIQLYIAEISSSNVRELKSAVTKVIYQVRYAGKSNLTVDDVKELLENHFSSGITKRLSINVIQKEVEQYYKVSHADLIGVKRSRNIAYARQVAIYLCRNMLDVPYAAIGKKFGQRDHSTVMHSVKQVEEKLRKSRELQEEIELITKMIREG